MNSEEIGKLKSRIAIIAVLKIVLFSLLGMLVIVILIDGIFQDFLANLVNDFSQRWYVYFKANKLLFMCISYLIVFCTASFFVVRSTVNSLALLIKSMDKIISNPEEEISLPNDLNILERRLNNI